MPTYSYKCHSCSHVSETDHPIGTAPRTIRCQCGHPARQLLGTGLYISAAARPTSASNVVELTNRHNRFENEDGPAYKRMRARGLQPERIDGCAQLENRVGDQDDIDYSRAIKVAEAVGGGKERVVETIQSLEVTHAPA